MASTYVNDLRLNEMATGDASGTWGTTTNTNLELIAEGLSFGTEAITTNADTHTSTVADGATDPARSIYIKYTGTLDSACTITIAPNTLSRLHFIENGTSGSQNIIISQGSGANITIPAGDTKAVYLDGAGSGAAVVDAFASLNVVDLKVQDDLTVTDDATIGGTLGVTGIVTLTDDLIIGDGKTIGSASDVDAMTIASNGQITLTQTLIGTALDISGDIDVDGTTNLDVVDIDGAVDMASTLQVDGAITNSSTIVSTGKITADAGIDIDNFNIDGTTIALSSGNLTLDAAGSIILDADSSDVIYKDGGTTFLEINKEGNNARIKSSISDGDIKLQGNDGGSTITALTLDMSEGGKMTTNTDVQIGADLLISDSRNLYFGAGNDLRIYHDGSDSYIKDQGTGNLLIQGSDIFFGDASGNHLMRIRSDGNITIGTTNDMSASFAVTTTANEIVGVIDVVNSSYSESVLDVACNRVTDDAYNMIKCQMRGHSNRLLVTDNGDVENVNNSYGAISDQRLKTDIADASSQWADIKAVKVRKFKYGMEPEKGFRLGVISQELEASGMNGLVKEKDADEYQIAYNSDLDGQKVKRVKYSVLYMKAIKALQEAMTRIETLETKVTALEG